MTHTAHATGVGIALTPELYGDVTRPDGETFDFLELDPDIYDLTPAVEESLVGLTERYPMTLHSTTLSICGDNELSKAKLAQTRRFVELTGCELYSDHLSYTWAGEVNLDLYMPPEFSDEMLDRLDQRLATVRDRVECEVALENVGMLVGQPGSQYSEVDFIGTLIDKTGVSLQLNLDSVAISATTLGLDPEEYLKAFPFDDVSLITVVPETSMNPVLRRRYGTRINELMNRMLEYTLEHCAAERLMVQGRRGDIRDEFIEYYRTARAIYYRFR